MNASFPPKPGAHNVDPVQERSAQARENLLVQATRVFAAKGYAGASTREICEAAGVNLSAIRYYFGNKEGLFRAALCGPIWLVTERIAGFDDPSLDFVQAMRMVLGPLLEMAHRDGDELQVTRLYLRESLEPTPIFRDLVQREILPFHQALAALLARHCNLAAADAEIHQLAFAMVAMANDYCISRAYMNILAPEVLARPQADTLVLERLLDYCAAMLERERQRRHPGAFSPSAT